MGNETEKIEARLAILDSDLKARNQTAETTLWGVAHILKPPKELLEDIRRADIMTLELPPGAISYRREAPEKDAHTFWGTVLDELERSGKIFYGVDANVLLKKMRRAIQKRGAPTDTINYCLRYIEEHHPELANAPEIREALKDDFFTFIGTAKKVHMEGEVAPKDLKKMMRVFVHRPFDSSIKKVCDHARARLEKKLSPEDFSSFVAKQLSLDYVEVILRSYEDNTQAKKILQRLQNLCKQTEKNRISHVHVGGYAHNENLMTLLKTGCAGNYAVKEKKDTRFPSGGGSTEKFFEKIPLKTRIGLVSFEKNTARIDQDRANDAFDRLLSYGDFARLVQTMKILWLNEPYAKNRSEYCKTFRSMLIKHLLLKTPTGNLNEIQKICEENYGKRDPVHVFITYLQGNGIQLSPETKEWIRKGGENRCI